MLETDETTGNFVLPTPQGGETELSREQYRYLIDAGGLSPRQLATITAAAQILDHVSSHEPVSLSVIVARIKGDPEAKASSTDRRALDALLAAELIAREGGGAATRYSYPGRRVR